MNKVVAVACSAILALSMMAQADDLIPSGDGAKWTYAQKWAGGAWTDTTSISTYFYNTNGTIATSKTYEDTAAANAASSWILRTIGTATYNSNTDSLPVKWISVTKNDQLGSWDTTSMTFTYNASNKPIAMNIKVRMSIAADIFATIEAKADVWYNGSGQQLGDSTLVKTVIPIMPNLDTTFKASSKSAYNYGTNYRSALKSTWDTTTQAWLEESKDSTIMTNDKKDLIAISQSKVNGAWVNQGKDSSIYNTAGTHTEIISMVWVSGASNAWSNNSHTVFLTTTPPVFTTKIIRNMIAQATKAIENASRSNNRYSVNGRLLRASYSHDQFRSSSMGIYKRTAKGIVVVK